MESAFTWEYMSLVNELTQGMEKANQLRIHLCSTSPSAAHDLLLQRILSSYEKALTILERKGSVAQARLPAPVQVSGVLEGSVSVDGSPKSEVLNKNFADHHQDYSPAAKKRKLQPTWTEQVKVNSDNGLEGPTDDGYSWRKYGQKDILGAKYPRFVLFCSFHFRLVQNCWATKYVQRSDEDPTLIEITYKGTHTCNQSATAIVPSAASPEKKERKQQNQTLMNLKANLRVSTENLDDKEAASSFSFSSTNVCHDIASQYFPVTSLPYDNHLGAGAYSPLFISPATSESNYFSPATYHMNSFGGTRNYQHSESDIAEIISANASTSNSPIGGMEFPADRLELDPNFPFDTWLPLIHWNTHSPFSVLTCLPISRVSELYIVASREQVFVRLIQILTSKPVFLFNNEETTQG